MTEGGCYETPDKRHLRLGRGRLPDHAGRVAALSLALDLLDGAPMPPNMFPDY